LSIVSSYLHYPSEILDSIVEIGAIPPLVKLCAREQASFELSTFSPLLIRDDYCHQLLAANFLSILSSQLKKDPDLFVTREAIYRRLSSKASPEQLIPLLSFLLRQLPIEASFDRYDVDDYDTDDDDDPLYDNFYYRRRCAKEPLTVSFFLCDLIVKCSATDLTYFVTTLDLVNQILSAFSRNSIYHTSLDNFHKLLSHLFLRDSPLISVDTNLLSSWRQFLIHVSLSDLKMSHIGPILLKLITNCSDLNSIIESDLFSSLLSRMANRFRDEDFVGWLLDLIDLTVSVIGKERKDEASLFLNHLVEFGILTLLVNSLSSEYLKSLDQRSSVYPSYLSRDPKPRVISPQDVAKRLRMITEFEKRYESQFKNSPLMSLFQSVLVGKEDGGEEEGKEEEGSQLNLVKLGEGLV
jgi:hypothetical protein